MRIFRSAPVIAAFACTQSQVAATPQPETDPGLARGIAIADSLVAASIGKLTPGAVLLVSRNGKVVHERAFGVAVPGGATVEMLPNENRYTIYRNSTLMRTSTMFDLASVTKVMATTFAMMLLVDRGQVDLDAPVNRYLTDFRGPHLDSITVRHLLQHSSGLVQWQPLYYQASNSAQTYAAIRDMPLGWGVGEGRHYSDLGFMLLGYIVERVSGKPLDQFVDSELYRPLGLKHTTFNPKAKGFKEFAATEEGNVYEKHMVYDSTFGYRYRGDPTSWNKWRDYVLVGETDDGNSYYANNGVAGHAGLFSTAGDLHVLLDLLDAKGIYRGKRFINSATIERFLMRDKFGHYLGWQYPAQMPTGTFMHTGFTGTYVMGVPEYRLSVVLLTNRQGIGPDAKGFFPNLAPLQAAVSKALVNGVVIVTDLRK